MHHYTPLKTPAPARRPLLLRHPVAAILLGCPAAGAALGLLYELWECLILRTGIGGSTPVQAVFSRFFGSLAAGAVVIGCFILFPVVISILDLVGIFKRQTPQNRRTFCIFAVLTVFFGILYSWLYSVLIWDTFFSAAWTEQLYNNERHQPLWEGALAPVLVLAVLGIAGYLLLSLIRIDRLPPLAIALSIAAMYLGTIPAVFWCLQIGLPVLGIGQHTYASPADLFMCLLPADCILLMAGLIRDKIHEWNERPVEDGFVDLASIMAKESQSLSSAPRTMAAPDTAKQVANGRLFGGSLLRIRLLAKLDCWLRDSANWPLGGLLLALPLLGIVLAVLALFGQYPDRFIRAFTETADWGLSQKTAPQNAFYDEHYLCTVAAGGHTQIVRPMRYGVRHGHRVVVNRQLCIANAFEQVLEEQMPRVHRAVRRFYDRHGYPLSRLIRTKGAADLVWLLMKPLEWLFLAVLYLCDATPENRIAMQYMPRRK